MIDKIKIRIRKIKRYIKNNLSKIRTNLNYLNHKKVVPRHLFYGQLNKVRSVDMLDELNKQIGLYKKHGKSKFVFVEIGNYLGESLELFGEQIHNNLKDNYLIVSIDPYIPYTSQEEEKQNKSQAAMMNKSIKKIYYYFLNNISNTIFKHNHFHLRMISSDAFKLLRNFNLRIDFCYIDASHYYENIKEDFENYNSILKNENNYKGKICGDDYELTYDEVKETFDFDDKKLNFILTNNKKKDYLIFKNNLDKKQGFHPGITLFFHEIDYKIKKYPSGFWCKFD